MTFIVGAAGAGLRVLRPTEYQCDTPVEEIHFNGRPTIAIVAVYDREVLFVKPKEGKHCILPQGGIERKRDETLLDAAYREGSEELGLERTCFKKTKQHVLLGEFLNPIPVGRGVRESFKHTFVLAIPVWHSDWVRLNSENRKFVWVGNQGALQTLIGKMAEERPIKFWGIMNAIDDMAQRGLIPWSSGKQTVH